MSFSGYLKNTSSIQKIPKKVVMEQEINLADYQINIADIRQHIDEVAVNKTKKQPQNAEEFTADTKALYADFAKEKMGIEFKDISLFITALTHRSYVNEHKKAHIEHNERLEFLGDAILELVTSDFLYRNFTEPEGIMTAWRSALVRTESIGRASTEIGYLHLIRLSKGEKLGSDRTHASIIADCFEAVTGAIYLDQGYLRAKQFIYQHILTKMDEIIINESWRDSKSYLQELAQKTDGATPQYHVIKEEGPDHDRVFSVNVVVAGRIRGTGSGHSKQEAQSNAATEGIKYYKKHLGNQLPATGRLTLRK